MRNKRMYTVMQRMNDIDELWNKRGVEDATAEDEWCEYEACLYALAEYICGR